MKLSTYRLGDLIEIKHGYAFSGTHITQVDNGVVLVTPGNFKVGGGFQEKKGKFFNGNLPDQYILEAGDVIVTMTDLSKNTDTLGYSALVPKSPNIYLHNQRIGLVTMKTDLVDLRYLYWLMRTHSYQRTIANSATGATVKHTSPSKIYEYQFQAPEKNIQIKIAEIFSAYDDLIENNQKQIKLLEEAAMCLYKEWFVNLRFPEYEHTKIVDGVPEGWQKSTFRELCELIKEGCKPNDISSGTPYIGLEHIPRRSMCLSEWGDSRNINSNKYRYKTKDVLFGKIRPYFHKVGFTINDGVCSTDAMVFRARENMLGLLLTTAFSDAFVAYSYATCREGTKMPRADWNEMSIFPVLIPSFDVLMSYDRIINTIVESITVLSKQNQKLKEARDKLIPKLMNFEIEV